jgi:hypothetical protein
MNIGIPKPDHQKQTLKTEGNVIFALRRRHVLFVQSYVSKQHRRRQNYILKFSHNFES